MFVLALNTMLSLFICMAVGYIGAKFGVITKNMLPYFNKLLINVTFPAMMISALNIELTKDIIDIMPQSLVVGFLYNLVLWVVAIGLVQVFRIRKHIRSIMIFCFIFTNVGFMGFPLIEAVYGQEGMVYLTLFNISFNILMFSFGILILEEDEKNKVSLKSILTMPVMLSIWFGLFLLLSQIIFPFIFVTELGRTRLPYFISSAINMVGDITSPLAMIVVGASLVETNIKKVFLDYRIHVFSFFKLIVAPILIYLIFKPFIQDYTLLSITVILSGLPCATFVVILAQEYDLDYVFASEIVFMTTLYSIITVPLLFLL